MVRVLVFVVDVHKICGERFGEKKVEPENNVMTFSSIYLLIVYMC